MISAVIIGQHEEVLLPRCLESLKGIDEIVFCYTGDPAKPDTSTDGTIDIARKYTNNITCFTWNDRFCDARNAAKKAAHGDWILSIDCDEVLQDLGAVKEAVALAEQKHALAVETWQVAENNKHGFFYPRLFKNVPEVFWEGAAHNTLSVVGERLGNVRITVGYSPAHKLDPDRTFRILKKEVAERYHPRSMFYLGKEYFYREDYDNCVITMGQYVQTDDRFLAQKADAFLVMAMAYMKMGKGEDARDACLQAIKINANFKEAILYMAQCVGDGRGNERWQKNADQWKKMAETADNYDVLFVNEE